MANTASLCLDRLRALLVKYQYQYKRGPPDFPLYQYKRGRQTFCLQSATRLSALSVCVSVSDNMITIACMHIRLMYMHTVIVQPAHILKGRGGS